MNMFKLFTELKSIFDLLKLSIFLLLQLVFINNQKFKQTSQKSLFFKTISKQFAGANKRRKLNNPLQKQAKT